MVGSQDLPTPFEVRLTPDRDRLLVTPCGELDYATADQMSAALLEQFDSSLHRLLTDALAMYEFVPGTVVHGGYGSLYERRQTSPVVANSAATDLRYFTVNRGLFFKVSYLKRF